VSGEGRTFRKREVHPWGHLEGLKDHEYTSIVGTAPGVEGCNMYTMENVVPGDPMRGSEVRTCHTCPISRGIGRVEVMERGGKNVGEPRG